MESNKNQDKDDEKQEDEDSQDAEPLPGEGATSLAPRAHFPPSIVMPPSNQEEFVGYIFTEMEELLLERPGSFLELNLLSTNINASHMLASHQDPRSKNKLLLDEEIQSEIFLDGALKITRTSFKGPFSFLARIANSHEVDHVREFLREQSMVMG